MDTCRGVLCKHMALHARRLGSDRIVRMTSTGTPHLFTRGDVRHNARSRALTMLLALALTGLGGCDSDKSPTAPSPQTPPPLPSGDIFYTALGASDAIGFGGSEPCVPFSSCAGASGYIPIIATRLRASHTVTVSNLGIPAAVISPEIQTIGTTYGRSIPGNFLDREVPFVPRNSNLITIFAGANDVLAIAAALRGGAGGADPIAYASARIDGFARDYETLINGIRERATTPRIVVLNLPNFAGLPFAVNFPFDRRQAVQTLSVGFSVRGINALVARGVLVVDLLCDPDSYDPALYSEDGYHPNDSGYQFIADRLLEAITSSGYPAPDASCDEMTIVAPN